MYCSICGNQINQGEKFCGRCGNQVDVNLNVAQLNNNETERFNCEPSLKKEEDSIGIENKRIKKAKKSCYVFKFGINTNNINTFLFSSINFHSL